MKIIANDYEPKDIFRFIREWLELTQEEIGIEMGKKGRAWAKFIENGNNRYYFSDLLELCKKNNIRITIEKK